MYGCSLGCRTWRRFGNSSQIESYDVSLVLRDDFDTSVVAETPSLYSTSANAVTSLTDVTTAAPAPAIQTTTSFAVTTATPAPATQITTSSTGCPAADGSTYTITNQVAPTARPFQQNVYSSLAYKVLCDTDFGDYIGDLQVISNTSSLGDCLNACALYSFQTPPWGFPHFCCSGLAWDSKTNGCWLKNNVTLSSTNQTSNTMPDGAVLITT